jgi:hypothetical protein
LVECRIPAKGISHSIKEPLLEENLRRKRRRRERRCASTGPEHGCLHDIAGLECSQTLHGDRWLNLEQLVKGISHSIKEPLLQENLRRKRKGVKGAVRPPNQSMGVYTALPGQNAVKHYTATVA